MVRQVFATGMPWGDKSLNEYVNRLGQNLARSSGSQQVFSFYVLYNPGQRAGVSGRVHRHQFRSDQPGGK